MKPRPPDRDPETRRQVAVLPMRGGRRKGYHILLVTSRETRRWVIPKGWPMKGLKPREAAMQEAYEEAGLVGIVGKRPLGYYLYEKRLKNGAAVPCLVQVFPMSVRKQLKRFPEQDERDGQWFTVPEAADAVLEPGLAAIIRSVANRAARSKDIVAAQDTLLPGDAAAADIVQGAADEQESGEDAAS